MSTQQRCHNAKAQHLQNELKALKHDFYALETQHSLMVALDTKPIHHRQREIKELFTAIEDSSMTTSLRASVDRFSRIAYS